MAQGLQSLPHKFQLVWQVRPGLARHEASNPDLKEVVMESITEQRFVDRLLQALATLPQDEPRGAARCAQDWARAERAESVPVSPVRN